MLSDGRSYNFTNYHRRVLNSFSVIVPGPDGISGYFISNLSNSIAYPIFLLFNKSLHEGIFPSI